MAKEDSVTIGEGQCIRASANFVTKGWMEAWMQNIGASLEILATVALWSTETQWNTGEKTMPFTNTLLSTTQMKKLPSHTSNSLCSKHITSP